MIRMKLNGFDIEAPLGTPLVEVIKRNGVFISNLCYIDGLAPYAGCRTCLVEIEGARGLQLSCTTIAGEGMVVQTETPEAKAARQQVLAVINANHSDRCLTCHRRVKCMPGDICLRDDVVTHRCVTCSKNYRCELQTTNELLDMGYDNVEPWAGEPRTYYQHAQPDPDRANPWLEFDPQMCIICTRCVRACDEVRHTSAITLAGRGFSTRIAFGAGGRVDESSCDFCGACIDVCPTATLMEKPNKWIARTEDWTSTTCNSCSVGCTLSVGTRAGRAVIVKPDRVNPVSDDQVCVRGRFHYDAIADKQRLRQHLVRRAPPPSAVGAARGAQDVGTDAAPVGAGLAPPAGAAGGGASAPTTGNGAGTPRGAPTVGAPAPQFPAHWGELVEWTAKRLREVIDGHGAGAVGVLGSPFNTNEENYLTQKLAREVIGTPHIDFSAAAPNRAVPKALEAAFGTEALPADMINIARSDVVVCIADDLESSHNVAALRIKDAIVGNPAAPRDGRLLLVSPIWGELADFAEPYGGAWLRTRPGFEAAIVDALAKRADGKTVDVPGLVGGDVEAAQAVLDIAKDEKKIVSVVYAPHPLDARAAGEGARAAANLAIALRGETAAEALYVLPTEANVHGARDMGVDPERGPGRVALERPGMSFDEMADAALDGRLKAMVIVGDNPLMFAPDSGRVRRALEALDLLVVIYSLPTDTAKLAHAVFADVPSYAKTGTYTNAERRVGRLHAALAALGDARPASLALTDLANAIKGPDTWAYAHPDAVTDEIAATVPGYDRFGASYVLWSKGRAAAVPTKAERQPVTTPYVGAQHAAPRDGALLLTTGRTLYTSLEGAAVHSPDADKLHREEFVELHPQDASNMRIRDEDEVTLRTDHGELTLRCKISARVQEGVCFVPSYYDGGAVLALFARDGAPVPARVGVRQPA